MADVQYLYNGGVPSNPMIDTYSVAGTPNYDSKDNITIYYPLNEGKDLVVYGNEYNNSEVFTGEIQGMATASWVSDSWRSSNGAIYGATWVNYPPSAFKWVDSKKDTINITKENLTTSYTFEWTKSTDFDGVSYMLHAKIGSTPWQVINEDIEGTSFESIYQEFLEGAFEPFPTVNAVAVAFTMDVTDGIDTTKMDDDPKLIYIRRYDYLSTVDDQIPTDFTLHENYPNPFNPTTTLRFDIPEISDVTVTIFNMIGQKIKSFNMQSAPAGYHSLTWDATNDLGAPVAAGVYLYQLQTEGFIKTKKMVLLK